MDDKKEIDPFIEVSFESKKHAVGGVDSIESKYLFKRQIAYWRGIGQHSGGSRMLIFRGTWSELLNQQLKLKITDSGGIDFTVA